jgi:hypothetical protein
MPLSMFGPFWDQAWWVVYAEKKLNKRSFVLIIAFFLFCRLIVLLLLKRKEGKPRNGKRVMRKTKTT